MKTARFALLLALPLVAPKAAPGAARDAGAPQWCGTSPAGARESVWSHQEWRGRRSVRAQSAAAGSFDVGQIAVLLDDGDLARPRNLLDLQHTALRFTPAGAGYSLAPLALPLEPDTGTRLTLADDDTQAVPLGFAFPFFGQSYTSAFVNSDGNVTFGAGDSASTARSMGRLVNGPPRVAPLLADLDPSKGTVSVLALHDHATVTWRAVPQFDKTDRNTFQATLWADGRIDFVYDAAVSAGIDEGVAGIAPGAARDGLTAVDLSTTTNVVGIAGAIAESFRADDDLDAVAVARRFYETHGDEYQQLVIYTSRTLVSGGVVSYELLVKNADAGIGEDVQDLAAEYGSAGRLESFVMMDALSKYPADLTRPFVGEDSALSVLAHEVGHRWLANALFRDGNTLSHELLGRDEVHWSFFMDTDGSFLEGNDIEPQSGGRFRTVGASQRYSALDQYLMGMRDASEVPPFFFVRNAVGASSDAGRNPQTGVVFSGTRKDVSIGDVVSALRPRAPAATPWAAPFRQAFVYVAVGGAPDAATIARLERIRGAWPAFFAQGTEGRGRVDPRLN
jgi:hypothetical protein